MSKARTLRADVRAFLRHCDVVRNLSPHTLRAYGGDLEEMAAGLARLGVKQSGGVDLFLLIEPDQLVRFDICDLADHLAWRAAAVTRLRVLAQASETLHSRPDSRHLRQTDNSQAGQRHGR